MERQSLYRESMAMDGRPSSVYLGESFLSSLRDTLSLGLAAASAVAAAAAVGDHDGGGDRDSGYHDIGDGRDPRPGSRQGSVQSARGQRHTAPIPAVAAAARRPADSNLGSQGSATESSATESTPRARSADSVQGGGAFGRERDSTHRRSGAGAGAAAAAEGTDSPAGGHGYVARNRGTTQSQQSPQSPPRPAQ
jgi:hypothetical protein